jgi:hypothetical protein
VHEFELDAFEQALAGIFPFVRILGQNRQESIVFAGESADASGSGFVAGVPDVRNAQFFLAVCAKQPVEIPLFIYAGGAGNLLRERERWALSLQRDVNGARGKIDDLHRELQERTHWAKSLEAELASARQKLQALEAQAAQLQQQREMIRASRWVRLGRRLNVGPDLSRDIE